MRRLREVVAADNWLLVVTFEPDETRRFDVTPLLELEAFRALRDPAEFRRVHNRGYFVAWDSGADLSADTLYLEGS